MIIITTMLKGLLLSCAWASGTDAAILSDPRRLDALMRSRTRENTVDRRDVIDPPLYRNQYAPSSSVVRPFSNTSSEINSTASFLSSSDPESPNWNDPIPNVWSDYYSVPWEMLNPTDLDALGLSQFTKTGRFFDVKSLGPSFALTLPIDENGLFIPGNTSLLFMFNTSRSGPKSKHLVMDKKTHQILNTEQDSPSELLSDESLGPQTGSAATADGNSNNVFSTPESNAAKIIQTSLPFGLPRYHYVINYSLLVPKHLLKLEHQLISVESGDAWVRHIGLRRVAIPLSQEMLQTNGPVLAFVFRSGESLRDFVEEEEVARLLAQEERFEQEIKEKDDTDATKHGLRGVTPAVLSKYRNSKKKASAAAADAQGDDASGSPATNSTLPLPGATHDDIRKAKGYYNHAKSHINDALVKSSSDVARAVLASSSTFFDNFARRWAMTVGVESLLHSTFCQVNCRYHEQSYCLKFEEEGNAVVSLLTVPSDHLNADHSDGNTLKKRGLGGSVLRAQTDRVKYSLEDRMYALSRLMGGLRDYANQVGIKNESRYYSLRAYLSDTLGDVRRMTTTSYDEDDDEDEEDSWAEEPLKPQPRPKPRVRMLRNMPVYGESEPDPEPQDDSIYSFEGFESNVDHSWYDQMKEDEQNKLREMYGRYDGSDGHGIYDGFDAYKAERDRLFEEKQAEAINAEAEDEKAQDDWVSEDPPDVDLGADGLRKRAYTFGRFKKASSVDEGGAADHDSPDNRRSSGFVATMVPVQIQKAAAASGDVDARTTGDVEAWQDNNFAKYIRVYEEERYKRSLESAAVYSSPVDARSIEKHVVDGEGSPLSSRVDNVEAVKQSVDGVPGLNAAAMSSSVSNRFGSTTRFLIVPIPTLLPVSSGVTGSPATATAPAAAAAASGSAPPLPPLPVSKPLTDAEKKYIPQPGPRLTTIRLVAPEINTGVFFGRLRRVMNEHDVEYQDDYEDEEEDLQDDEFYDCDGDDYDYDYDEDDYEEDDEEEYDDDEEDEGDCEDDDEEEDSSEQYADSGTGDEEDGEDDCDGGDDEEDISTDTYYDNGQFDDLVEEQEQKAQDPKQENDTNGGDSPVEAEDCGGNDDEEDEAEEQQYDEDEDEDDCEGESVDGEELIEQEGAGKLVSQSKGGQARQDPPRQVGDSNNRTVRKKKKKDGSSSKSLRLGRRGLSKRAYRAYSKVDALKSMIDDKFTTQADCVPITWKLVFEHAFYGVPEKFCTREQTLAQLRQDYKDDEVREGSVPQDRPYEQLKQHWKQKIAGTFKSSHVKKRRVRRRRD